MLFHTLIQIFWVLTKNQKKCIINVIINIINNTKQTTKNIIIKHKRSDIIINYLSISNLQLQKKVSQRKSNKNKSLIFFFL